MDQSTVKQLLELNHRFYKDVAEPFSESRQQPWEGWHQLLIQGFFNGQNSQPLRVLDLGCGNGRFLQFLSTVLKSEKIEYVGVDQSPELLAIAQKTTLPSTITAQFLEFDIFQKLPTLEELKVEQPFDLVVLFGVLHHLPSQTLREGFFSQLHPYLSLRGKVIFTTWLFLDNPRLKGKIIEPELIGINKNELEEHDYILDWQRGDSAFRYCHYYSESEVKTLLSKNKWGANNTFLADGHDHHTNRYYVVEKLSD